MERCGLCGREGLGESEAWVTECCDAVQCWLCLYGALRLGLEPGKQYQCLSISCLQAIPESLVRLAASAHAADLLRREAHHQTPASAQPLKDPAKDPAKEAAKETGKAGSGGGGAGAEGWGRSEEGQLGLRSASPPHRAASLSFRAEESLVSLARRALVALGMEAGPKLRLLVQHGGAGEAWPLAVQKSYQSLGTLELGSGDVVVVDAEGVVPTELCPLCGALAALSRTLVLACGHSLCEGCAGAFAGKHGRGGPPWDGLPCPEPLCPATYEEGEEGGRRAALAVWAQREAGAAPRPLQGESSLAWAARCAKATGLAKEEASLCQADSRGLRLLRLSDRPASAPALLARLPNSSHHPIRLIFVPTDILHQIKFA